MADYASGAIELLIALQTPSPKGYRGVPALVWGAPGTGKSTFIESLAHEQFPVITLIASLHDPTDFNGLPVLVDGRVRFAPPEWVHEFERHEKGILFLDELTTAPPTVQAALLRLVLERKVGLNALPSEVRIVAAANPPEIAASGWELSPPLANRFVHIHWQLPGETYQRALETGEFLRPRRFTIDRDRHRERAQYWRILVANFLKRNPALTYTQPSEDEYAFATPRTWDYAIALMASCDLLGYAPKPGAQSESKTPFESLIQGCIGEGAAKSFQKHLNELRIPDPEAVLKGEVEATFDARQLREDELFILFSAMATYLRDYELRKLPQLPAYIERFLQGALQVAKANKHDSIYIVIRALARDGKLRKWADEIPAIQPLMRQINPYFEEIAELLE